MPMLKSVANTLARMRRFEHILAYAVIDEDMRPVPEFIADNYATKACLRNAIGLADCHDDARHEEARGDLAVIVRLYGAAQAWHSLRPKHVGEALQRLNEVLGGFHRALALFEPEAPDHAPRPKGAPPELFATALVQQRAAAARRDALASTLKSRGPLRYLARSDFISVADGMLEAMRARRWYSVTAQVRPNWPLRQLVELGECPPVRRHLFNEPRYSHDPEEQRKLRNLLAPMFDNPVRALRADVEMLRLAAQDALQVHEAEQEGGGILAVATPAEVLCLSCASLLAHNSGRESVTGSKDGTIYKAYGALLPIIDPDNKAAIEAVVPQTALRAVTHGRDNGELALDAFDQVRDPYAEWKAWLAYEYELSGEV